MGLPHLCIPTVHASSGRRKEPGLGHEWDEIRAVSAGGQVYLAGGIFGISIPPSRGRNRQSVRSLRQFKRFDPTTRRYVALPPMPVAINYVGIATYHGDVYVVGGDGAFVDGRDVRQDFLRYDVRKNRWERLPRLPTPRGALAVGVIGDRLYAAGGMLAGNPGHAGKVFEIFDFRLRRCMRGPDMPTAREHLAGAVLKGRFYVIGGRNPYTDALPNAEAYDPRTKSWQKLAPLPVPSGGLGAVAADGAVYAIGGGNDRASTVIGAVQKFDERTLHWSEVPTMRTKRHGFGVAFCRGTNLDVRRLGLPEIRAGRCGRIVRSTRQPLDVTSASRSPRRIASAAMVSVG